MCYNSNEVFDQCPTELEALVLSLAIFNMLEEAEEIEFDGFPPPSTGNIFVSLRNKLT